MTMSTRAVAALGLSCLLTLAACGGTPAASPSASGATAASATQVAVTNCGAEVSYPAPVTRIHAHDSGIISIVLATGAGSSLTSISSLDRDRATVARYYGTQDLDRVKDVATSLPSLESLIALNPQVVFAGWNYGFKEGGVTPDRLTANGITPYLLTESCRPAAGQKQRGVMPPWDALRTDLANIGKITGHEKEAAAAIADLDTRLAALQSAPQAATKPSILLFDSASDTVFTSGNKAGPQAVIDAAGGVNVMADVDDSWTKVSWERVAQTRPDFIAFVEYGSQTFAEKVALLESNPATKDLPAVKEKRFLNLPYTMWVSSPLNIPAAEQLRARLEQANLGPKSQLAAPKFDDHVAVSTT